MSGRKGVSGPFLPGSIYLGARASTMAEWCSAPHTSFMKQMQNAPQRGDAMKARSQGKADFSSGGREGFFWSSESAGSWGKASGCGCAARGGQPQGEPPNDCWHQRNLTDAPGM